MDYSKRVTEFQKIMRAEGIDGSFITRRFVIGYFTGAFTPWSSAVYIPVEGEPILMTFEVDVPRVKAESYWQDVRGWILRLFDCVDDIVTRNRLQKAKLGFEIGTCVDVGVLTAGEYLEFKETFPDACIVNVLDTVNNMQLIKTPEEIDLMRRAAEAVDLGEQTAFEALCIGMTETELAGWAELGMRRAGSMFNWCVTGTEIGAGYNQCRPLCFTSIPTHKRVQRGEIVTVDIHSMYDLYISDLSLNCIIGQPTNAQTRLADNWKTLAEYMMSRLKPGAVCGELFSDFYGKACEMGVDDYIVPSFSHGLGLDARIPPSINPGSDFVLQENMAIELILQMTEPNIGGMRLEYPMLIRDFGAEPLSKMPLDLRVKPF
ncbi:MAG: Xaa-Pro peptidase family protein [Oscillospiraceae bacterium]